MTAMKQAQNINLVVSNPAVLQHGSAPRHRFDTAGGTIGCRGANWILTDQHSRIQPIHCEVMVMDGAFCVVDRSGQTRINGSDMAVGKNASVRLAEGDVLHIGPYEVAVHLQGLEDYALPDPSRHLGQYGVAELLNGSDNPLDDAALPALARDRYVGDAEAELLHASHQRAQVDGELDPLRALEASQARLSPIHATESLLDTTHYGLSASPTRPDLAATRFEAITDSPRNYLGNEPMQTSANHTSGLQNGFAAAGSEPTPLLQGLNVQMENVHGQEQLLLEAGQALQAAIKGIAALYGQPADAQDHRLSMLRRTLQPIEDNPLRLGLDYPETVSAMFGSQRSLVHLSPKAAIDESLSQARQHNIAVVKAIAVSLDALLRAFSPDVLLQRFERYRSSQATPLAAGDWAWQMYSHYYNELASSRQQGFEKLFWEVFEQAYDRALREEAQ